MERQAFYPRQMQIKVRQGQLRRHSLYLYTGLNIDLKE